MQLASEGIFVARFPDHEVSGLFRQVAATLVSDAG